MGIVPDNFFESASNNANMLQVVFVVISYRNYSSRGEKRKLLVNVFDAFNDVIILIVDLIMKMSNGVFVLMAGLIVDLAGDDLSKALELLVHL